MSCFLLPRILSPLPLTPGFDKLKTAPEIFQNPPESCHLQLRVHPTAPRVLHSAFQKTDIRKSRNHSAQVIIFVREFMLYA